MAKKVSKDSKLKKIKTISSICLSARQTSNNCFLTLSKDGGDVIKSFSFGSVGISSSQKGTLLSYDTLFDKAIDFINLLKPSVLSISMRNIAFTNNTVSKLENLASAGIVISGISSIKTHPHGGCRARKERRT
jgi:ribosomal protein S11